MAVALIVAAGSGERLGLGQPKALAVVAGRPMLEWSVRALRAVAEVRTVVIALPAGRLDAAPPGTVAVAGGATRSQSVRAALRAVGPGEADEAVIVHDAARALVLPSIFSDALARLTAEPGIDAVIAAAPVTDTVKQVTSVGLRVEQTIERSLLWAVQTPQVFRRSALQRALDAPEALLDRATDDAWLVEQQGGTVVVLPCSPENFKITTPLDLRLAELILRDRSQSP